MRTSARKKFCVFPRIEKEIPRKIDRALRAQNFAVIAQLRKCALEAIARDRNFSAIAQFRQEMRVFRSIEAKKIFDAAQIVK